jgi:regulator of sigma D
MQFMTRGNREDNTEKTRSEATLVQQVSLRFELEDPLVMLCHASQYTSTLPYPSCGKMLLITRTKGSL